MAYLLRRLQSTAPRFRLICSTATIGGPNDFIQVLTGRDVVVLGSDRDGSHQPIKTLLLARPDSGSDKFQAVTALLKALSGLEERFLAFADSRRMVEQIVASANRQGDAEEEESKTEKDWRILPYRAGYEEDDRKSIQQSLEQGKLNGVVSTSALELGLDIGDINLLVLLDTPPSVKAFWQRVGRAGRRREAFCIFIDAKGIVADGEDGLKAYLRRPLEHNYLYLENRYIQYTNALCAAAELQAAGYVNGQAVLQGFVSLPTTFTDLLRNEINPTEAVAQDLYPLKQRAQNGPHREFPVRTGMEKNFEVEWTEGGPIQRMGQMTFGQAIREAYPGAIYYYMARPYRVYGFDYKRGKIRVKRDRHYTTRPQSQAIVFPRFQSLLKHFRSDAGFLSEVELQVSERVTGFIERRGRTQIPNVYGTGSPYYQFPLNRLLDTSGVCWYFPDQLTISEAVASVVGDAFCLHCGVQSRDIGVGRFHAQQTPLGTGPLQGMCIFDSTHGSLRLTEKLAVSFPEIIRVGLQLVNEQKHGPNVIDGLERLFEFANELESAVQPGIAAIVNPPDGWVTVVAVGEAAIYDSQDGAVDVVVEGYWPTASGMTYRLHHDKPGQWLVPLHFLRPVSDKTKLALLQPSTGEIRPLDEHGRASNAGA